MTPTQQLLLDCLHHDADRLDAAQLSRLSAADLHELVDLASRQHVRPRLLEQLSAARVRDAVPGGTVADLTATCHAIARRNLQLHAELSRLLARLREAGIPVILLKGVHVASALYGNIAMREIGDIDLLVRAGDLERATSLLMADGLTARTHFHLDADVAASQHATPLFTRSGIAVELHWNLTEPGRAYSIDPAELWERAVPVQIAGAAARALSNEDLLLHLCFHTAYQHRFEFGLRSLCDLAQLLHRAGPTLAWQAVRARADRWGWTKGAQLALRLAGGMLPEGIGPTAAEVFQLDDVADALTTSATLQVLSGYAPASTPARGLATLGNRPGLGGLGRDLTAAIFLPRHDLRRAYPRVPAALWWSVYLLRGKDVLQRNTGLAYQLWIRRDTGVVATRARQRVLRDYLFGA